jgi:hypothetical protein
LPLLFSRSVCTGQNLSGSALKTSDTSVFSQYGPSQSIRARQCLTRSRGRCRRSSLTARDSSTRTSLILQCDNYVRLRTWLMCKCAHVSSNCFYIKGLWVVSKSPQPVKQK